MAEKLILVVDDEPANRAAIADALEDEGYRYLECEDGQVAWDFLRADGDEVGVVLLDWMMPVMDGPSLLQKIKSDAKLKEIPVILQTAKTEAESQVEGLDLGAFQYLPKPFDDAVLLGMIRSAMRHEERLTQVRAEAVEELQGIRDFTRGLIAKERAKAEYSQLCNEALSRFFPESLACRGPEELISLVLRSLGQLTFNSAAQEDGRPGPSSLRASLLVQGATEIHQSDRGQESRTDRLILRHVLSSGQGAERGPYTAFAAPQGRLAVLLRNTPADPAERSSAIRIASLLAEQAEGLLMHWDAQLRESFRTDKLDRFLGQARGLLDEQSAVIRRFAKELETLWDDLEAEVGDDEPGRQMKGLLQVARLRSEQLMVELTPSKEACQEQLAKLEDLLNT